MKIMKRFLLVALLVPSVFMFAGCTSAPLFIHAAPVDESEETLGAVEGKSMGFMLFEVIPIGQNTRFQRAYADALSKSGGTRLVGISIKERWFWAGIGNGYIFKVSGLAVRPRSKP